MKNDRQELIDIQFDLYAIMWRLKDIDYDWVAFDVQHTIDKIGALLQDLESK